MRRSQPASLLLATHLSGATPMISELPFILEGVLLPTVGTLGLMGNIASVAVLRSR